MLAADLRRDQHHHHSQHPPQLHYDNNLIHSKLFNSTSSSTTNQGNTNPSQPEDTIILAGLEDQREESTSLNLKQEDQVRS